MTNSFSGGNWISSAVRLAFIALGGGTPSPYSVISFIKSGTGLPTSDQDINFLVSKVSEESGEPKEKVAEAMRQVRLEEERAKMREYSPERWVREPKEKKEEEKSDLGKAVKAGLAIITGGFL